MSKMVKITFSNAIYAKMTEEKEATGIAISQNVNRQMMIKYGLTPSDCKEK